MTCQEFVELVTEYLEGAMSPSERVRFAAHIDHCDGCAEYLVQFRETITVVGHLPGVDRPAAEEKFLARLPRLEANRARLEASATRAASADHDGPSRTTPKRRPAVAAQRKTTTPAIPTGA